MRNRPHGLTRVSAKSAATGKFEAEQWVWPDPSLGPNFIRVLKSKNYMENPKLSVRRGVRVFLRRVSLSICIDKTCSTCTAQSPLQVVGSPQASSSGLLIDLAPAV